MIVGMAPYYPRSGEVGPGEDVGEWGEVLALIAVAKQSGRLQSRRVVLDSEGQGLRRCAREPARDGPRRDER